MIESSKNHRGRSCTSKLKCNSFVLRISIASLVLSMHLVDSQSPADPDRLYPSPNHNHRHHYRHYQNINNDDRNFEMRQSLSKNVDLKKNSRFKLKSPDFDVSFEVSHAEDDDGSTFSNARSGFDDNNNKGNTNPKGSSDSNDELVRKAILSGILLKPDRFPASNDVLRSQSRGGGGVTNGERISGEIPAKELFIPKALPECESSTICETSESYPTEYIKELVKNLNELQLLAGIDPVDNIAERINEDEDNLCPSNQRTWFPQIVRKDAIDASAWQFVINVDTYKQGFIIDECSNPGHECTKIGSLTDGLEIGYSAICKQQLGPRKVVVLSRENGTAIVDSFPFRTGCCCHISRFSSQDGEKSQKSVQHPFQSLYNIRKRNN